MWERDVLIDAIHKYNAGNGSFEQEYAKYFTLNLNGEVNATGGKMLKISDYTTDKLNIHF